MNLPKRLRASVFNAVPGLSVSETLFDGVDNVVFCIKNAQRQYVAVNDAFVTRARMRGKDAIVGRTARELFPPLLAAGYEQQDEWVFSTGKEIRDKVEMVTNPDGSTGWYLALKIPVRDTQGRIVALAGISRDLGAAVDHDPRFPAIADAIERIQTDFADALRIEELARDAGMSLSLFERRVRAVLRVSPRQFLTKTRIDAAARALHSTSLPLSHIAAQNGFYDQATFCRQFRHATGMTPRQFRLAKD